MACNKTNLYFINSSLPAKKCFFVASKLVFQKTYLKNSKTNITVIITKLTLQLYNVFNIIIDKIDITGYQNLLYNFTFINS